MLKEQSYLKILPGLFSQLNTACTENDSLCGTEARASSSRFVFVFSSIFVLVGQNYSILENNEH